MLIGVDIPIGCCVGFILNKSWKYGEQTDKTILCACSIRPSAANVTSTRSPRDSRPWKPVERFE